MKESITEVRVSDSMSWDLLFNASLNKVPFSSSVWRSVICEISGLSADAVIVFHNDLPVAGINLYYKVTKRGKFGKHPFLTPYNTILFTASFNKLSDGEKGRVTGTLASFIKTHYIYPYFLCDTSLNDVRPFQWSGYRVQPGYTYLVNPATANPDADIKRRARRCAEEGFYIKQELNADVFYDLFEGTASRQGIKGKISKNDLQKLFDACNAFAWGFTAYDSKHVPHASWIQMSCDNVVYNWNAAANAELLSKGGTPFLVVELLKKLAADNCISWDLCGADHPSVARFKGTIGGVLTPYFKIDFSSYSLFKKIIYRLNS